MGGGACGHCRMKGSCVGSPHSTKLLNRVSHLSLSVGAFPACFPPLSLCRVSSRKLWSRLSSGTKSSTLWTFERASGERAGTAGSGKQEKHLRGTSRVLPKSRLNSGSEVPTWHRISPSLSWHCVVLLPPPPNYGVRTQIPICFQHCTLTWRGRTSLGSWGGPKEPSDDTTFLWCSWCRNRCGQLGFRQQPWRWRFSGVHGKGGVGQALLGGARAGAP